MFKDVIGIESFRNFTLSLATVGILPRSDARYGYQPLWLFNLAGFLIFFAFVALARQTALGQSFDFSAEYLGAVVSAYVLLLGLAGAFGFLAGIVGLDYQKAMQMYDRVIICVMIGLIVMGTDVFLDRAIYNSISDAVKCETITCFVTSEHCERLGIAEGLVAAIYVSFGWLALTINSVRFHFRAFFRERSLALRAALGGTLMLVIVAMLGGQLVRILVFSTAIIPAGVRQAVPTAEDTTAVEAPLIAAALRLSA